MYLFSLLLLTLLVSQPGTVAKSTVMGIYPCFLTRIYSSGGT